MSTALLSISGPINVLSIERISDRHRLVSGQKFLAHFVGDRFVHDDATGGSAALARRSDRAEEDRLRRHFEIGARRNDERVVSAQFHDRSPEPAMDCFARRATPICVEPVAEINGMRRSADKFLANRFAVAHEQA